MVVAHFLIPSSIPLICSLSFLQIIKPSSATLHDIVIIKNIRINIPR